MLSKYKNLPNWISSIRIFLIPPILYLILKNREEMAWWCIALFFFAGISDYFDGMIARKYRAETVIGKFLDPIADKLLVSACLIALLSLGKISILIVVTLILRDIFIDGIRCVAASQNLVIPAGPLGKWKTAIQMLVVPFLFFPEPGQTFFAGIENYIAFSLWFTVFLSLASAIEYTRGFIKNSP